MSRPTAPIRVLGFALLLVMVASPAPAGAPFPTPGGAPFPTPPRGGLLDFLFPPEPDEPGPWAVGRVTLTEVDASRDRSLPVDVWYPVDEDDATGPFSEYDLVFTSLVSDRALDGPPPSSAGPFPMVIFSHGNDGIRFQSFFLCEQLASHGFVVVAPDHVGNTALDLIVPGAPFETRDRPLDVSFVISRLLERSADPADPFHGRISPWRIGVAGHSFGGFTTLAIGSGFQDVPPDPRVLALMPISPASSGLSDEALGSILQPTLIVGGTADTTTPIDPQSTRPFALIPARPRYRVDVLDAGHNSFTDICAIGDALLGAGLPPDLLAFLLGNLEEACDPDLIDIEEAHRLTNLFAVSFLRTHVAFDPRYRRFLGPFAAKREPDVVFFQVPGCGHLGPIALVLPVGFVLGRARRRRRHDDGGAKPAAPPAR